MEPFIWIAVALPGVGKSYWIDQNVNRRTTQDILVLGSDRILDEIAKEQGKTYNEVFRDNIDEAQAAFFWDLGEALDAGRNIFVDRTNLNYKSRAKILRLVPARYKKLAIVFKCDPKVHEQRLASRVGKFIAPLVINSMKSSFQYPTRDEGFDEIKEIDTNG